ncbi:hypothetical protein, conserved [Angomonas deanei]|uniref:Uncharacterized protein n=1 Tax=Angomonas deanei TaxID=59799 RepID=A0A7G2CGC8_9TRYP|nr:hypothetical protein, conserved [Angomonas deanei]
MYVLQEGVSEVPDVIGPPKDMAPFLTPFMSQQASFRPAYSTDTQSPVSLAQPWENTRFSRGAPASRGTQRETSRFSFPVPDSGHAAPVKRSSEVVSGLSRNTSLRNVESPTTHKVSRYQTRAAEPSPNPSPRDAPAYSVSPTQSGRIDPAEERRPFTKKEGRHYLDYKPLSSSVSLLTEARLPRPSKSPRVFSDITPKIFQLRNGESVIRDERVHIEHQSQLDLDTLRAELRKEEADMQRSLSR